MLSCSLGEEAKGNKIGFQTNTITGLPKLATWG